jgi:hypothetical protein
MYLNIKPREMKKEAKVEYGITITKPWSKEMYDHNEEVADLVRNEVNSQWQEAMNNLSADFNDPEDMLDAQFDYQASPEMIEIQRAVTCYGFGFGYTVLDVSIIVEDEIESAPLFRLKEIAEELELVLEKGFIGFN